VYYVYILASKKNGTLYVGVTNHLERRLWQHRTTTDSSAFTKKYTVGRLVYYETYQSPKPAIAREKQLKAGSRKRKLELIEAKNPNWSDLSKDWVRK